MDNDPNNKQAVREAYEPPIVEDIPVRADEQVLAGCKTFGGTGSGRALAGGFCGACVTQATS